MNIRDVLHSRRHRSAIANLDLLTSTIEHHGGRIERVASGFHVQLPQFFPDTARETITTCMIGMSNPLVRRFQFAAPATLVDNLCERMQGCDTVVMFRDGNTITLAPRRVVRLRRKA